MTHGTTNKKITVLGNGNDYKKWKDERTLYK